MKTTLHNAFARAAGILLLCGYSLSVPTPRASHADTPTTSPTTETIVMIRHGEKTPQELGQLSERGLMRAFALPSVLVGQFGKPDFIFAPNPSDEIKSNGDKYSYVRPLATIEPTAVSLGMPVNTQIGYKDISGDSTSLQATLEKPKYANATIFVAWEHVNLDNFAKTVVAQYGGDPSQVPAWSEDDYDTIFIIRLKTVSGKTTVTFTTSQEGLNCPSIGSNPAPVLPR